MAQAAVSAAIAVFSLFMLLWRIKISPNGQFYDDYFSIDQTRSIKGMCAVFILFSHVCTYLGDVFKSLYIFKYVGAIMVAGFFFVSGYGLQYGVMNKKDYLSGFFKKRILSLAVPYYIINIFYIVTNNMDMRSALISLTGYNLWFVMAIAIFYIGFYICAKLFVPKRLCAAMTVFVLAYMAVMNRLGFGFWWYNSCLAFPAGMWLCRYKDRFRDFFSRHYAVKMFLMLLVFAASYAYYCIHANDRTLALFLMSVLSTTLFAVILALLSMKVRIKNPILHFCGGMSLELYLTHALWISWLRMGFWYNLAPKLLDKDAVYFAAIIAGTVIMSFLVHTASGYILKLLRYKPRDKSIEKSVRM